MGDTLKAQILVGDVLHRLRGMESQSVQCVVTSPPYWGLRDYKIQPSIWGGRPDCEHDFAAETVATEVGRGNWAQGTNGRGEIQPGGVEAKREPIRSVQKTGFCIHCSAWLGCLGLEPTPELFIEHATQVFAEVRRVLRNDGTLWLNIGDSYAAQPGQRKQGVERNDVAGWKQQTNTGCLTIGIRSAPGLKPKDLVGIPWMLAFALRSSGWFLRQDIIWSKVNPMPESVRDRCTKAHEYLFLMSKSAKYFYDQEAILEDVSPNTNPRLSQAVEKQIGSERANGGQKTNGNMKAVGRKSWKGSEFYTGKTGDHQLGRAQKDRKLAEAGSGIKSNESFSNAVALLVEKRNKRSVWKVTTQPYSEAHFATYPEKLVEPCILAGSREGDTVLDPVLWLRHHRRRGATLST